MDAAVAPAIVGPTGGAVSDETVQASRTYRIASDPEVDAAIDLAGTACRRLFDDGEPKGLGDGDRVIIAAAIDHDHLIRLRIEAYQIASEAR